MIVQCGNCQTKYNLPDAKIPDKGAKVKCSKCGNTFKVEKPRPEPEDDLLGPLSGPGAMDDPFAGLDDPAPRPGGAASGPPQDDSLDDLFSDSPPRATAPAGRPSSGGTDLGFGGQDSDDEPAPAARDAASGDFDLGGGAPKPASRLKLNLNAKNLIILIAAAVLLLGGGGAAYFFLARPEAPALPTKNATAAPNATAQAPAAPAQSAAPAPSQAEQVKNISLKNVRQYYVTNEKAGQLFVVEGRAVNNFATPKEMLQVEAALYDAQGSVLVSKKQTCGNTLSLFQLQVQSLEEIEKGLGAEVGILTNNTFIKPGMDVPFMVVLANPPENLKEFGIKVVSASDPAPESAGNK